MRSRNAVVVRAAFSELYVDRYLFLATQNLHPREDHDRLFKDALAAFVLHCAIRPHDELIAWTLHFEEPLLNIFLAADTEEKAVTGRIFTEDVRVMGANHLYADVVRGTEPTRRSAIPFAGADPFRAAEAFYLQSEQRPARFFAVGEEEFAMVCFHPDCDQAWFDALDVATVRDFPVNEPLGLLERRRYGWHCGCNQRRILKVLTPAMRADPEGLFGGELQVEVRCPRCAARYVVTRAELTAFVAGAGAGPVPPAVPPARA